MAPSVEPIGLDVVQGWEPRPATESPPADFLRRQAPSIILTHDRGARIVTTHESEAMSGSSGRVRSRFTIQVDGNSDTVWPGERVEVGAAAESNGEPESTDGYCPPWMPTTFRPELADLPSLPRYIEGGADVTDVATIFPQDERKALADQSYPWCCTGFIQSSDGKSGGGVVIGPRTVLTASHVVPWDDVDRGNWWMTFRAGFNGRTSVADSPVQVVKYRRKVRSKIMSDDDLHYDYALLRLYYDMPWWLRTIQYHGDWNNKPIFVCSGYPMDYGVRPAVQTNVSIDGGGGGPFYFYLKSRLDVMAGSSGSPVWGYFDDGSIRVVAVVSGENPSYNTLAGGPNGMQDLINEARKEWG